MHWKIFELLKYDNSGIVTICGQALFSGSWKNGSQNEPIIFLPRRVGKSGLMKKDESSREMPIPGNPDVVVPFMAWNEAFGVSIEKIDEQHKRLMSLMNYLNDAVDKGEEQGVLGKALSVLAGYRAHHCRAE
jgi:hypothetical protein